MTSVMSALNSTGELY